MQSTSQPKNVTVLRQVPSNKLYGLVTEAPRCEQLAHGDHSETQIHDLNDRKSNVLPLSHLLNQNKIATDCDLLEDVKLFTADIIGRFWGTYWHAVKSRRWQMSASQSQSTNYIHSICINQCSLRCHCIANPNTGPLLERDWTRGLYQYWDEHITIASSQYSNSREITFWANSCV